MVDCKAVNESHSELLDCILSATNNWNNRTEYVNLVLKISFVHTKGFQYLDILLEKFTEIPDKSIATVLFELGNNNKLMNA